MSEEAEIRTMTRETEDNDCKEELDAANCKAEKFEKGHEVLC